LAAGEDGVDDLNTSSETLVRSLNVPRFDPFPKITATLPLLVLSNVCSFSDPFPSWLNGTAAKLPWLRVSQSAYPRLLAITADADDMTATAANAALTNRFISDPSPPIREIKSVSYLIDENYCTSNKKQSFCAQNPSFRTNVAVSILPGSS
jgi:hypothetical protein